MGDKRKVEAPSGGEGFSKRARSSILGVDITTDQKSSSKADSKKQGIRPQQQPKFDLRFGQKFAFPGLDQDEESNDTGALPYDEDETMNGLTYLRMVRSQAESLPLVLDGIPRESSVQQGNSYWKSTHGDAPSGGFYSDGVFIACPTAQTKSLQTLDEGQAPDPQEKYYMNLGRRFEAMRSILRHTPPATMIASLGDQHPIYLPRGNKPAQREWATILESTAPKTIQLACMDMESVRGVLEIVSNVMEATIRNRDLIVLKRLGAWVWGLLGRCREIGELNSDEVSDIRQLGKEAARNLFLAREMEKDAYFPQDEGGRPMTQDAEIESDLESIYLPDDLLTEEFSAEATDEAASRSTKADEDNEDTKFDENMAVYLDENRSPEKNRARQMDTRQDNPHIASLENEREERNQKDSGELGKQGGNHDEFEERDQDYADENYQTDTNVRAMLDMILTIVGECFGQKDLLEFRDIWDEDIAAGSFTHATPDSPRGL